MHEHALIHNVITAILQELGPQPVRVREVDLKVGALELHGEESFRQMFAVESQGTALEGAKLKLTVIPAFIKCACGHEGPSGEGVDHHSAMPVAECPKCSQICRVQGGRGVTGIDLKVCDQAPVQNPLPPRRKP